MTNIRYGKGGGSRTKPRFFVDLTVRQKIRGSSKNGLFTERLTGEPIPKKTVFDDFLVSAMSSLYNCLKVGLNTNSD